MPAMSLGPILGAVTSTAAKVWLRSDLTGPLTVECSANGDFSQPAARVQVRPDAEHDMTAVAELTGLSPETRYSYRVTDGSSRVDDDGGAAGPTFWTMPSDGTDPGDIAFGFGSCFNPFKSQRAAAGGRRLLGSLLEKRETLGIRFMILLGDQVYTDSFVEGTFPFDRARELEEYYQVYRKYWSDPQMRDVLRSIPTFMIFDDHELWNDWGTTLTNDRSNWFTNWRSAATSPRFLAALKAYEDYQQAHNPDPISGERFTYTFECGRIGFFVLDVRTHRGQVGTSHGGLPGPEPERRPQDLAPATPPREVHRDVRSRGPRLPHPGPVGRGSRREEGDPRFHRERGDPGSSVPRR